MLLELNQLPMTLQSAILSSNDGTIEIINNGKVIKKYVQAKSYIVDDFNYDLNQMKKAVESPSVDVPYFESDEDFFAWLNNEN